MPVSAPTTDVDICNIALDHLGQPPVNSIENPTSTQEYILQRHYAKVRRSLLRQYVWNFAKARAMVSRAGTPEFDYEDEYQLPNDCVRILSVGGERETTYKREYDIEGRKLLLNNGGESTLKLRYIKDVTNVTLWDALFVELMTYMLAEALAYKVTLKKGVKEQITEHIKLLLSKAISIDGQERPPRRVQRSVYLTARRGGRTSLYDGMYTVIE